jgi:hypothetical protein
MIAGDNDAGDNDTDDNFFAGINNTGEQLSPVTKHCDKFIANINDTCEK